MNASEQLAVDGKCACKLSSVFPSSSSSSVHKARAEDIFHLPSSGWVGVRSFARAKLLMPCANSKVPKGIHLLFHHHSSWLSSSSSPFTLKWAGEFK